MKEKREEKGSERGMQQGRKERRGGTLCYSPMSIVCIYPYMRIRFVIDSVYVQATNTDRQCRALRTKRGARDDRRGGGKTRNLLNSRDRHK